MEKGVIFQFIKVNITNVLGGMKKLIQYTGKTLHIHYIFLIYFRTIICLLKIIQLIPTRMTFAMCI